MWLVSRASQEEHDRIDSSQLVSPFRSEFCDSYKFTQYLANSTVFGGVCNFSKLPADFGQDVSCDVITTWIRPKSFSIHVHRTGVQLKCLIYQRTSIKSRANAILPIQVVFRKRSTKNYTSCVANFEEGKKNKTLKSSIFGCNDHKKQTNCEILYRLCGSCLELADGK